eukprot:3698189-Pleurochrysis_carterae.AAC.1
MAGGGGSPLSVSRGILWSRGSRFVEVLVMSGPEGLDTVDTPLPLALGGVWCSTPMWGSETRVAT